jgi:hypothetical protein
MGELPYVHQSVWFTRDETTRHRCICAPAGACGVCMKRGCLRRRTLKAIAAGQCPPADLAKIRRHLPRCPRCQAAMVKAASDPLWGDTVEDEPPAITRRRSAELLAVGASVLAAVGAWRYGASSPTPPAVPAVVAPAAVAPRAVAPRPTDPCPVGEQPSSPPAAASLGEPANPPSAKDERATPAPPQRQLAPAPALPIRYPAEHHLALRAQPAASALHSEPPTPTGDTPAAPETGPALAEPPTVLGRIIRTSLD